MQTKEQIRNYHREYRKKHHDTLLIKKREYDKKNHDRNRANINRWRGEHPERMRGYVLKKKYGITQEEYNGLLRSQNNRCAMCGTDKPSKFKCNKKLFSVDHDHKTGKVRGLLCNRCNVGLGYFEDGHWMGNASKYLNWNPLREV